MTTEIMSFFEKNPLTTPVGQRIASATDASLASENWALNMEICDLINDTEDGPKDGIKAIRKRLQQNAGKNYTVVMYTLTVLETCVKNCGKRFHVLACSKDFVSELVKLIGPKNDPPTVVQEKVLSLIQSWADAFRHQSEMSGVVSVYSELRQKGIEFPMTDLDTMAPIITPQRTVTDSAPPVPRPVTASPPRTSSPQAMAAVEIGAAIPQSMTPEQMAKLRSEMDIVKTNMSVLSSMLSEVVPGKEHPSDLTLLQELHATCRAMQRRLVDLVGKLANDQMTAELLHINDEMNNLFLRYSRYEKNRDVTKTGGQPAAAAGAEAAASLIDLSEDAGPASAASSLAGLAIGGGALSQLSQIPSVQAQQGAESAADSEFDKLAQARNVTLDSSKKGGSTYQDNLQPDQSSTTLGEMAQSRSQLHRESDFDEIEAWLGEKETGTEAVESLTSSEFERFLAERAAAAENLPPTTTSSSTRTTTSQSRNTRELDKDDKENSLFAL
ncbi:TOM1-like protein 2 isoform X1 [Cloeon dipterum]|uniref:TOM1-like protein 2 isoform X1 n=1 Tax=Cloeon dipterum TaxID=197152 RepID=UPI0032201888